MIFRNTLCNRLLAVYRRRRPISGRQTEPRAATYTDAGSWPGEMNYSHNHSQDSDDPVYNDNVYR